jgi:hypothetical protein
MYPQFIRSRDFPGEMTCEQIDSEIRKTDSIRWSMQQDGLEAITPGERLASGVFGTALAVILFPVDPVEATLLGTASAAGQFAEDAVTLADYRLVDLLQLKQIRDCPAVATANREQTDLEVLGLLLELRLRREADEISASTHIRERTRHLDALRPQGDISGAR